MPETESLKQLSNGRWMDTKYRFGRGTRVRRINAPDRGRLVKETFEGEAVWEGDVQAFHLHGHHLRFVAMRGRMRPMKEVSYVWHLW